MKDFINTGKNIICKIYNILLVSNILYSAAVKKSDGLNDRCCYTGGALLHLCLGKALYK